MQLTEDQKRILAQTLLGEAGGEGYKGMLAVASVIKNRTNADGFPNDPVSVVLQPKQFSTWNKGQGGNNPGRFGPGSPGYADAIKAVDAVFSGKAPDPTGGATHYWSPSGMRAMGYASTPSWAKSEQTSAGQIKIGDHVFLPKTSALSAIDAATSAPPMPSPSLQRGAPPPLPVPPIQRSRPSPGISDFYPSRDGITPTIDWNTQTGNNPLMGLQFTGVLPPDQIPYPAGADQRITARNTPPLPAMDTVGSMPAFDQLSQLTAPQIPPLPAPTISNFDRNYGDLNRQFDAAFGGQVPGPNGFTVPNKDQTRLPQGLPGQAFAYAQPPVMPPLPLPRPQSFPSAGASDSPVFRTMPAVDSRGLPPVPAASPSFRQNLFGLPTLSGNLGIIQNAVGSAVNPNGPERARINNWMHDTFLGPTAPYLPATTSDGLNPAQQTARADQGGYQSRSLGNGQHQGSNGYIYDITGPKPIMIGKA